ncbi:MAG TPA: glycosyl hydrolase family 65 protein [Feifaniaceae bacterium]|nr:glycosyl hydrolase family 65 protein [Feifaniaceae bacterium]
MIPEGLKLTVRQLNREALAGEEALFHCANGYLGVRGCFEEGYPPGLLSVRGAYINGFYDDADIPYGEKLYGFPTTRQTIINLPDAQTVTLCIDGERLDPFSGGLMDYERTLDMRRGVTERRMLWRSLKGHTLRVTVRRMASFRMHELFLMEYEVESVDYAGPVHLKSTLNGDVENYSNADDPRVAPGADRHLLAEHAGAEGGTLRVACRTGRSGLTMACHVRHVLEGEGEFACGSDGQGAWADIAADIRPGGRIKLYKFCVYSDSLRVEDPSAHAADRLDQAVRMGAAHWYAEQREYLGTFWENARVLIDGDPDVQGYLDFNLYQLLQSAGQDGISNVPAKGLSGEGYEGHYFWDTEIYVFPFFLFTDPALAKSLLDYRYGILPRAREHARLMGHETGALYPWRTIAGSECSSYFPSGSAQYHINADVAHSFIQYYLATGDIDYMAKKGAEVLVETARLWLDAGHMENGRFLIDCVTGPDEYTCLVNNNYYTNAGARENLRWAADICAALREAGLFERVRAQTGVSLEEERRFLEAAEAMYLPYDESLGILMQDDSFLHKKRLDLSRIPKENFPLLLHYHPLFIYRHQVCKQPDAVLALYLFGDGVGEDAAKRTYAYYEAVTTHDSSLSKCIFSIMAARLKDAEKAYGYLKETASADLNDAHANTRDGLHVASVGGAYLAVISGFCGLSVRPEGIVLDPRLPQNWSRVRFRVHYRGSVLFVDAARESCSVTVEAGGPQRVKIGGAVYTVGHTPVTALCGG